ncbi:MAG: 30S ribosomal protein S2 [Thermoproteota archaeon]
MSSGEKNGEGLLILRTEYIAAGVHIGTKVCTVCMRRFVRFTRPDGLNLIEIAQTDEKIRIAARGLSRYDPGDVIIVSGKEYGRTPVLKMCEYTGFKPIVERFPPGIFSNPKYEGYISPKIILVSDPKVDEKAIREATLIGIPVIGICDTDDSCSYIDLIIPANNKGRSSLALVFWLLTREVLRNRGVLSPTESMSENFHAFETQIEEAAETV